MNNDDDVIDLKVNNFKKLQKNGERLKFINF